jgi:uncharacterized SAM-binding protein YcdF (DUF218 family)
MHDAIHLGGVAITRPRTHAALAAYRVASARGVALCLGAFSLLNIVGDWRREGFDANLWWIDLHPLPARLAQLVLLAAGGCLLTFGARPAPPAARRVTRGLLWGLLGMALGNAIQYYVLLANGTLHAGPPLPFSLLVAAALWVVLRDTPADPSPAPRWVLPAAVLACLAAFPLAQIFCYGRTDYRRPADAIVVFGARAYADGGLSQALRDRTDTAVRLYHQGYAPRLIFSGGPGDGPVYEAQAMRDYAVRRGVPARHIVLDLGGVDTRATVRNTAVLFRQHHLHRVIAVSHFYHLPRVKLAYQRAGYAVYTVPAAESYPLTALPAYVAREVAALWVYYLRG